MNRWIALICSEEADALQSKHPNAFLLLVQIARRARWKDCIVTGMKTGEAYVGDFRNAGLETEMVYRHAKKRLEKSKIATFRGTNKGTIATLVDSSIFSLSPPTATTQATGQQRSRNDQGTTNNTDIQKTQTSLALNGASSAPAPGMAWSPESGFSGITQLDLDNWKVAYPAVDISRQIAAASEWLKANPNKQKKNYRRFLTSWLSRSQEKGGDISSNRAPVNFTSSQVGNL